MAYSQQSDLETRFGAAELLQLADRDGNGTAESGVISTAIADADTEIDGYLAGRYPLPLVEVPAIVKRLSCDIARYRLWEDRVNDKVRQDYEDAVDLLKRIANGMVQLVFTTAPSSDGSSGQGGITLISTPASFTDSVMAMGAL
jgi:phage gp36-like protein